MGVNRLRTSPTPTFLLTKGPRTMRTAAAIPNPVPNLIVDLAARNGYSSMLRRRTGTSAAGAWPAQAALWFGYV